jgi:uncharacterized protein
VRTGHELNIVFAGPTGAGKTTAISSVSDTAPASAEVLDTERRIFDYGELVLEDGTVLRLYGTPVQACFSFMRDLVGRGALGIIFLIDSSSASSMSDLVSFIDSLRRSAPDQPCVIGVGRLELEKHRELEAYAKFVESVGVMAPVFAVDVRQREDVLLLIETLLCILEMQTLEISDALSS